MQVRCWPFFQLKALVLLLVWYLPSLVSISLEIHKCLKCLSLFNLLTCFFLQLTRLNDVTKLDFIVRHLFGYSLWVLLLMSISVFLNRILSLCNSWELIHFIDSRFSEFVQNFFFKFGEFLFNFRIHIPLLPQRTTCKWYCVPWREKLSIV